MTYAGAGAAPTAPQCGAVRFDVRCQLQAGHAAAHVAMTRHVSSRRSGFASWTADGRSTWEYNVGPQPWAYSYPRVA